MKKLQNVGRQTEAFFLNIIFRRIYQSGAKCILCCFVHVVHTELSEDILPVGIHGMETGEALLGDFLGSHTQGDILENLGFLLNFAIFHASCDLLAQKERRYTTSVNAFVRIEKYLLVRIAPLWFITIQQFFFDCNTLFEKNLLLHPKRPLKRSIPQKADPHTSGTASIFYLPVFPVRLRAFSAQS